MVNSSSENSPELEPMTYDVMRDGRRFPSLAVVPIPPSPNRIRQLLIQPSDEKLPDLLSKAIWQRLSWPAVQSTENPDRESLVAAYIKSLQQLDVLRDDVQRVFREACRANLEFQQETGDTRTEARDAILNTKLNEMIEQASCDWDRAKNIVGAALLAQPPNVYRQKLDAALEHEVANFAKQLFEFLARLVDRELCGLVEWFPNNCCRYHFFRRVVIQDVGETKRVNSTVWGSSNGRGESQPFVVGSQRTTSTTKGTHEVRHARHEHEVISAVRTSIGNSSVVMPPQILRLVEAIPEWLYPFVEVIDGHIVRERIVAKTVSVEDWAKVEIHDEPIYGIDPAIVIGPFVLSGWGSVEVRQEQERLVAVQQTATQQFHERLAPVLVIAAIGLSGIALWLQHRWLQGHGGLLFVILSTATAIVAASQALSDYAIRQRFAAPKYYVQCMTIGMALVLFLAEWGVARIFNPLSWVPPLILGAAAYLCFHFGRQFR